MPHKAPPIPPEQRSFRGQKADIEGHVDKTDRKSLDRKARASQPNQFIRYQQDR